MPARTAILDVDGTLVDTNYHHALAWYRALRRFDFTVEMWKVHRHIGMGGDQFVPALIGEAAAAEHGDGIREAEAELYAELIGEVKAVEGATELIEGLRSASWTVVLASSAKPEEVEHYLDLLDVRELVDAWTSSADVENTKPAPDLVRSALDKVDATGAVMVGDSTWDVKAARSAGILTVAVLTGGFSEGELRDAGAVEVCESVGVVSESLKRWIGSVKTGPRAG